MRINTDGRRCRISKMIKSPLVSVIVPTKNSSKTINNCLRSIKSQSYKKIEIIVIDNNSTDNTKILAKQFTPKIFNKGPERSQQRNFGAEISRGKYLLFIDSDMELEKNAVKEGVEILENNKKIGALVIPERSIGKGYWGECKVLEKSFYKGVSWIEAARFYRKNLFMKVKGFDLKLISGEDWDLSNRVGEISKVSRTSSFVIHNEGNVSIIQILKKKYYYSKYFSRYVDKSNVNSNSMIVERYNLFLSNPKKLFKHPLIGSGMLFLKTCEFGVGSIGYVIGKFIKKYDPNFKTKY